ncbi:hypothetical protein HY345_04500 [Candidatus Microgenomates bacterium]|nr:hypothetical protein [Candidatus Microgenomates bacterium]
MAVRIERALPEATGLQLPLDGFCNGNGNGNGNGDLNHMDNGVVAEAIVSPEAIRFLKRESIHRRIHAVNYGLRWFTNLEQYMPQEHRDRLFSSKNADHGELHKSQLRSTAQDFWYNVGVVDVEAADFDRSLYLVAPFFHAIEFHDHEQALWHKKNGHGEAGAIFYALAWRRFRDDLKTPGTVMNDSLINLEHNALTALVLLYDGLPEGKDRDFLFHYLNEKKMNDALDKLDQNGFLEEEDRRGIFIMMDNICQSENIGDIIHTISSEEQFEHYWDHILDYTWLLENYFLTDEQIVSGATMIMNHGSPERVVSEKPEEGVHQFTLAKALSWMKKEMQITQLNDLFEIYPALAAYRQKLTFMEKGERDIYVRDLVKKLKLSKYEQIIIDSLNRTDEEVMARVVEDFPDLIPYQDQLAAAQKGETNWTDQVKFSENAWKLTTKWTKHFTAVDLFWTINGGLLSVWRTLKTSSKMFKEHFAGNRGGRPLFVWHTNAKGKRESRNDLDYKNRSALKDKNGNPRSNFDCDLDRWLAEFRLPLRQLCDNEWFLNMVGKAYKVRVKAIRLFANAVAWRDRCDFQALETEIYGYMLNDTRVFGSKARARLEKAYGSLWGEMLDLIGNKKAGLTEPSSIGGVTYSADEAVARFKRMLKLAEDEVADVYPPVMDQVLEAKGYRTQETPVVFVLPEDS